MYKLDFMEIDYTYDNNIRIHLLFTNGVVPKSICNHHI